MMLPKPDDPCDASVDTTSSSLEEGTDPLPNKQPAPKTSLRKKRFGCWIFVLLVILISTPLAILTAKLIDSCLIKPNDQEDMQVDTDGSPDAGPNEPSDPTTWPDVYKVVVNWHVRISTSDEETSNIWYASQYFPNVVEGDALKVESDPQSFRDTFMVLTLVSAGTEEVDFKIRNEMGPCTYDQRWTTDMRHGHMGKKELDPWTHPDLTCVDVDGTTYDYHVQVWVIQERPPTEKRDSTFSYRVSILDRAANLLSVSPQHEDAGWWRNEENLHWYGATALQGVGDTVGLVDEFPPNDTAEKRIDSPRTITLIHEGSDHVIFEVNVAEQHEADDEADLCGGWQHVFVVPMQDRYYYGNDLVHYCDPYEIHQEVDVVRMV